MSYAGLRRRWSATTNGYILDATLIEMLRITPSAAALFLTFLLCSFRIFQQVRHTYSAAHILPSTHCFRRLFRSRSCREIDIGSDFIYKYFIQLHRTLSKLAFRYFEDSFTRFSYHHSYGC